MAALGQLYAEAVLTFVDSQMEADEAGKILGNVCSAMGSDGIIRDLLLNPELSCEEKKDSLPKILAHVASNNVHSIMLSFFRMLIDKNELVALPQIAKEYDALNAERQKTLNIAISSAMPLDGGQIDAIRNKYKKIYGAESAKAKVSVDSSLLGGICVQIGDSYFDSTLLAKLQGVILDELKHEW